MAQMGTDKQNEKIAKVGERPVWTGWFFGSTQFANFWYVFGRVHS